MAREWKPGDVALLTVDGFQPEVALRVGGRWIDADGVWLTDGDGATIYRPLFVIDPDDGDALDDICKALVEAMHRAGDVASAANGVHPATMRAALRSLLEPPKPPEPTGLGAVVEDADGYRWTFSGGPQPKEGQVWYSPNLNGTAPYSEITAVRVLSEGVTA